VVGAGTGDLVPRDGVEVVGCSFLET